MQKTRVAANFNVLESSMNSVGVVVLNFSTYSSRMLFVSGMNIGNDDYPGGDAL